MNVGHAKPDEATMAMAKMVYGSLAAVIENSDNDLGSQLVDSIESEIGDKPVDAEFCAEIVWNSLYPDLVALCKDLNKRRT